MAINVLITGSNGFVGSRLMFFLEEKGCIVTGIDRTAFCNGTPHPTTQIGDIAVSEDLYKTGDYFDWIIHAAAEKHDFGISEKQYFATNVKGTENITAFARTKNIKKILYYSTVSVYGHLSEPCGEDGPIEYNTVYGESKFKGEEVLVKWQKESKGNQLLILRPSIIYGRDNYANMYNLIRGLYKFPIMIGSGKHIKSMVSLANLIDMTWFSILNMNSKPIEIYNCLDKPYLPIKSVIDIIVKNPGFKQRVFYIPYFLFRLPAKLFDFVGFLFKTDLPFNSNRLEKFNTSTYYYSEKIREAGYVQIHSVEDEINKMVQWFLEEK